jgi:hypothetical protein
VCGGGEGGRGERWWRRTSWVAVWWAAGWFSKHAGTLWRDIMMFHMHCGVFRP